MLSTNQKFHFAPTSPISQFNEHPEASSSNTTPKFSGLKREARQAFLEHLNNSAYKVNISIRPEQSANDALEEFRNTTEFKTLVRKTNTALNDILQVAQQECTPKIISQMKSSFGEFLSRMKFPRQNNPWFECQSGFQQLNPRLHSNDEMFNSYQASCPQIQILGKLINEAIEEKLGITEQKVRQELKPFLNELPTLITVCGAGSLLNIEELLNNIKNQLLPGDLGEQYDKQVELIVRENIRQGLRHIYGNDPHHEINEIHRTLAVRKIAAPLLRLPDISIEHDPYAKSFLSEIYTPENINSRIKIVTHLMKITTPSIEPHLICSLLAENYLEEFRHFLQTEEISKDCIPFHKTNKIEEIIQSLKLKYGIPPINYLLDDVDRSDYSRTVTQSTNLLAAWFLHTLDGHNLHTKKALHNLQTLVTKIRKNKAQYEPEHVYQIDTLCWTKSKDPRSGHAAHVTIDSLSKEWLGKTPQTIGLDEQKQGILIKAIINTANHIRQSDSNNNELRTKLSALLQSPECEESGLNTLQNIPAEFLTSEDKVLCLLFMQMANRAEPEKSPLLPILIAQESILIYSNTPKKLREMIIYTAVEQMNKYPELVCSQNPAATSFVEKICRDRLSRSAIMNQHSNLLSWAFSNQNANLTQLIIDEKGKKHPSGNVNSQLQGHFPVHFTNNKTPCFAFPYWPIELACLRTTPLGVAAIQNDLALMKVLLEKGADSNTADQYGHTALSYAAAYGSTEMVLMLLNQHANPNGITHAKKSSTIPPLFAATLAENENIIDLLIDHGADINKASDSNKLTPLHAAYKNRNLSVIRKLYSRGAKHNVSKGRFFDSSPFSNRQSPIEGVIHELRETRNERFKISASEINKQYAQVYVLHHIENKIHFDKKPLVHGYPLLHALSYQQNLPALEMMMEHLDSTPSLKAELLNSRSSKGTHHKTPLMVAAKQGAKEVAEYLLLHPQTDITLKDSKGRTALDIAIEYCQYSIIDLLNPPPHVQTNSSLNTPATSPV